MSAEIGRRPALLWGWRVLVFAVAAPGAAIASAETISYSFSANLAMANFAVPQFDPGLGLLHEVTLAAHVQVTGDWPIENLNPDQGGMVSGSLLGDMVAMGPPGPSGPPSLRTLVTRETSGAGYVGQFDGVQDFSGPDSYHLTYDYVLTGSATITSGFEPDYVGSGTVNIFVGHQWYPGSIWSDPGVSAQSCPPSENVNCGGVLTYVYEPLPEPSTFALLAASGAGLLAYGWRRRKTA
jgi:hypothetical protein